MVMELSRLVTPGLLSNLSNQSDVVDLTTTTAPVATNVPKGFTDMQWYKTLIAATKTIMCIIILIVNPLTLVAIAKFKELKRLITNIFVFSLSVADLLGGTINLWIRLNNLLAAYGVSIDFGIFWWQFALGTVAMYSSIFSVVAISIERAVATLRPMSYRTILTYHRCVAAIVLMWLFNLCFIPGLMLCRYFSLNKTARSRPVAHYTQMFPDNVFVSVVMPIIYAAMVTNILLYLLIFRSILAQNRKVGKAKNQENAAKESRKVTKMAFLIVGLLLITWTPQYVEVSIPYPDRSQFMLYHARACIHDIVTLIFLANPWLNCFVYAWQHKDYREAYKKLLGIERLVRVFGCSSSDGSSTGQSSSVLPATASISVK